jgi:hypothetical protein
MRKRLANVKAAVARDHIGKTLGDLVYKAAVPSPKGPSQQMATMCREPSFSWFAAWRRLLAILPFRRHFHRSFVARFLPFRR